MAADRLHGGDRGWREATDRLVKFASAAARTYSNVVLFQSRYRIHLFRCPDGDKYGWFHNHNFWYCYFLLMPPYARKLMSRQTGVPISET